MQTTNLVRSCCDTACDCCSPNSPALSGVGVGAQAKVALQEASRDQVTLLGWRALFQKKDKDGGGSLDFEEFSAIVRGDCDIRVTAVSAPDLRRLFSAIDTDDSGQIEESEFCEYITSDALAMPMSYAVFTEAIFQLTQLWVEVEVEEHYVEFLQHLLRHITTGTHLDEFKGEVSDKGDVTFKSSSVPSEADEDEDGSASASAPGVALPGFSQKPAEDSGKLLQLEEIDSLASADGCVSLPGGMRLRNPRDKASAESPKRQTVPELHRRGLQLMEVPDFPLAATTFGAALEVLDDPEQTELRGELSSLKAECERKVRALDLEAQGDWHAEREQRDPALGKYRDSDELWPRDSVKDKIAALTAGAGPAGDDGDGGGHATAATSAGASGERKGAAGGAGAAAPGVASAVTGGGGGSGSAGGDDKPKATPSLVVDPETGHVRYNSSLMSADGAGQAAASGDAAEKTWENMDEEEAQLRRCLASSIVEMTEEETTAAEQRLAELASVRGTKNDRYFNSDDALDLGGLLLDLGLIKYLQVLTTAFGSLDTLVQQARAGIAELFAELLELTMTEEHARKLLEALGFGDALRDALRALAESRANAADGTEGGEGAEGAEGAGGDDGGGYVYDVDPEDESSKDRTLGGLRTKWGFEKRTHTGVVEAAPPADEPEPLPKQRGWLSHEQRVRDFLSRHDYLIAAEKQRRRRARRRKRKRKRARRKTQGSLPSRAMSGGPNKLWVAYLDGEGVSVRGRSRCDRTVSLPLMSTLTRDEWLYVAPTHDRVSPPEQIDLRDSPDHDGDWEDGEEEWGDDELDFATAEEFMRAVEAAQGGDGGAAPEPERPIGYSTTKSGFRLPAID